MSQLKKLITILILLNYTPTKPMRESTMPVQSDRETRIPNVLNDEVFISDEEQRAKEEAAEEEQKRKIQADELEKKQKINSEQTDRLKTLAKTNNDSIDKRPDKITEPFPPLNEENIAKLTQELKQPVTRSFFQYLKDKWSNTFGDGKKVKDALSKNTLTKDIAEKFESLHPQNKLDILNDWVKKEQNNKATFTPYKNTDSYKKDMKIIETNERQKIDAIKILSSLIKDVLDNGGLSSNSMALFNPSLKGEQMPLDFWNHFTKNQKDFNQNDLNYLQKYVKEILSNAETKFLLLAHYSDPEWENNPDDPNNTNKINHPDNILNRINFLLEDAKNSQNQINIHYSKVEIDLIRHNDNSQTMIKAQKQKINDEAQTILKALNLKDDNLSYNPFTQQFYYAKKPTEINASKRAVTDSSKKPEELTFPTNLPQANTLEGQESEQKPTSKQETPKSIDPNDVTGLSNTLDDIIQEH